MPIVENLEVNKLNLSSNFSSGLEFLMYLISKETQLCPEPSQLFRADSYATKVIMQNTQNNQR